MTDQRSPAFVSFTGADDQVDIQDLIRLDEKYKDRIEFGILYFPEKNTQPRNPSEQWIHTLHREAPWLNTTAHLCGKKVFEDILAMPLESEGPTEQDDEDVLQGRNTWKRFDRLQLNINARHPDFTREQVWGVYDRLYNRGYELVLQYNLDSSPVIIEWLNVRSGRQLSERWKGFFRKLHLLYDSSRGRGVPPSTIHLAQYLVEHACHRRYAGGINSINVMNVIESVVQARAAEKMRLAVELPWGLDLESGCRTLDNEFDLAAIDDIMTQVYGG